MSYLVVNIKAIWLSSISDLPGHGVMLLHHAVADALPSLLGPAAIRLAALAKGGAHLQLISGPFHGSPNKPGSSRCPKSWGTPKSSTHIQTFDHEVALKLILKPIW